MRNTKTIVLIAFLLLAGGLLLPVQAGTDTPEPKQGGTYRAVYFGNVIENAPFNLNDNRILCNSIFWAGWKTPFSPTRVYILDTQGSFLSFSWWSIRQSFGLCPGAQFFFQPIGSTLTASMLAAVNPDVLVLSNAWHGPPSLVPPPNPGGIDWTFSNAEITLIENYVSQGHGLIATGGSFGQFSYNTAGNRNYNLANFMGLVSTGGGNAACADSFPWSRDSSVGACTYPNTRPMSQFIVTNPTHPIVTTPYAVAGSWFTGFPTAVSQWMALAGAVQVARAGSFSDSLITAFEFSELTTLTVTDYHLSIDYGMPASGTIAYVSVQNTGNKPGKVSASSLSFSVTDWKKEVLSFSMDDTDGDGKLDVGGTASWAVALLSTPGWPDGLLTVTAVVTYNSLSGMPATADAVYDVAWKMGGNTLSTFRHHDTALRFIRAALRDMNAGQSVPSFFDVVDTMGMGGDANYKDAHSTIAPETRGPGYWGLSPGQGEGENNGNGQGGLSGK